MYNYSNGVILFLILWCNRNISVEGTYNIHIVQLPDFFRADQKCNSMLPACPSSLDLTSKSILEAKVKISYKSK